MKRIKAACLEQTIHFQLKEAAPPAAAAREIQNEYGRY